ncbi:MAG: hypothetical protein ABL997_03165, partial [Planctomycetota bacterium]
LLLEYPVCAAVLGRFRRRWWEPLAWTLAVNVATHPLFSWWVLARSPTPSSVLAAEFVIASTEAAILAFWLRRRCGPWRAFLAAFLANAVSYLVGSTLFSALGE